MCDLVHVAAEEQESRLDQDPEVRPVPEFVPQRLKVCWGVLRLRLCLMPRL